MLDVDIMKMHMHTPAAFYVYVNQDTMRNWPARKHMARRTAGVMKHFRRKHYEHLQKESKKTRKVTPTEIGGIFHGEKDDWQEVVFDYCEEKMENTSEERWRPSIT